MTENGRGREVLLIESPEQRDRWLGWEIDKLEASTDARLGKIEKRLTQLLVAAAGLLVSTTTTAITLVLTSLR